MNVDRQVKCWEWFNCAKKNCPAYRSGKTFCWLIPETHFRKEMRGRMFGKIEMCFNCVVFKSNMNVDHLEETLETAKDQLTQYREMVEEQDRELEEISMELAVGFSEVFEALRDISTGDPTVRISEDSGLELIRKLKEMVNLTAENMAEFVDLCHEFAIGLAEHFDVLHKVSRGDLDARVRGVSGVELLESLKAVTNQMIESVETEIARRKKAREELVEYTAELEKRNEEVRQFAYIVSHDLRAPLVNLKGFAGELKISLDGIRESVMKMVPRMDIPDKVAVEKAFDDDIPEALGFIESSVARMDGFINSVLELSRAGGRKLNPVPLKTKDLVEEILKSLAHQIEKRGARVVVGEIPDLVADLTVMERIFGNILCNAATYLDDGRPGIIEISGEKTDRETVFRVKDNGIGICAEDMPKVFAPFRRAANPAIPGEGMGLAYVQALIRRHGGNIGCESEPGVGTVFTFSIPDFRKTNN